jgi:pimeloyl-ACP methyl ester carboxylesterase
VLRDVGDAIAAGMHNAVACTEDLPFIVDDEELRAALGETYLGANTLEFLAEACAIWPQGVIDPDFKEPWRSDIPTLLLSGEADPVTPPHNGERALATLGNARHLVGPGQGHGLAMRGCVPRLIAEFITDTDPEGLDADCVDRIQPAPFFLRFTGPDP